MFNDLYHGITSLYGRLYRALYRSQEASPRSDAPKGNFGREELGRLIDDAARAAGEDVLAVRLTDAETSEAEYKCTQGQASDFDDITALHKEILQIEGRLSSSSMEGSDGAGSS